MEINDAVGLWDPDPFTVASSISISAFLLLPVHSLEDEFLQGFKRKMLSKRTNPFLLRIRSLATLKSTLLPLSKYGLSGIPQVVIRLLTDWLRNLYYGTVP